MPQQQQHASQQECKEASSKGQFAVRTLTKTKERRRRRVVVSRAVAAGMRLEDAAAPMA
jgi:hypothetical protein